MAAENFNKVLINSQNTDYNEKNANTYNVNAIIVFVMFRQEY